MTTKAQAQINLTTNEKPVVDALNRASHAFKSTGSSIAGSFLKANAVLAGFNAAVRGARAAADLLSAQTLVAADGIGKMAARVGTSASELEALQQAAGHAGSSAADMDRAMTALATRASMMPQIFQKYGIAIKDSSGEMLSTREILGNVAEKMSQASTQSQRLALAQETMDESGRSLVLMLQDGRAALDAQTQAMYDAGTVITQYESNAAALLSDRYQTLQDQSNALSRTLGSLMAPIIESLSKTTVSLVVQMRNWVIQNRAWLQTKIVESMVYLAESVLPVITQATILIVKAWAGWRQIISLVQVAVNSYFASVLNNLKILVDGLNSLPFATKLFGDSLKSASEALGGLSEEFTRSADESTQSILQTTRFVNGLEAAFGSLRAVATNAVRDAAREFENLNRKLEQAPTPSSTPAGSNIKNDGKNQKKKLQTLKFDAQRHHQDMLNLQAQYQAASSFQDKSALAELRQLTGERREIITSAWQNRLITQDQYQKDILALEGDFQTRKTEIIREAQNLQIQENTAGFESHYNAASNLASNLLQLTGELSKNQIAAAEQTAARQIEEIQNSSMSEEQKAERIAQVEAKLDKKRQQIEKAQFERNKSVSLVEAGINTAVAVTKALTAGVPPFNFIVAGLVAAAGLAQIAAISASSYNGGVSRGGGTPSASAANSRIQEAQERERVEEEKRKDKQSVVINFNGVVGDPQRTAREIKDVLAYA